MGSQETAWGQVRALPLLTLLMVLISVHLIFLACEMGVISNVTQDFYEDEVR